MDNLTSHDAEVYLNSDFVSCNQFPLLVPSKVRLQVDPKAKTLIVVRLTEKTEPSAQTLVQFERYVLRNFRA
jgi:hypothetical protein